MYLLKKSTTKKILYSFPILICNIFNYFVIFHRIFNNKFIKQANNLINFSKEKIWKNIN